MVKLNSLLEHGITKCLETETKAFQNTLHCSNYTLNYERGGVSLLPGYDMEKQHLMRSAVILLCNFVVISYLNKMHHLAVFYE